MAASVEWGLWIAACALLVAAAKFVDDYHVKNSTRSSIRDALTNAFIYLDNPHVTNFPQRLYAQIGKLIGSRFGRFGWIVVAILGYFAVICSFYFGRAILEGRFPKGFLTYAVTWVSSLYWAAIMVWGIICAALSSLWARWIINRWNRYDRFFLQFVWLAEATLAVCVIWTMTFYGFIILSMFSPNYQSALILVGSGAMIQSPIFVAILGVMCLWHIVFAELSLLFLVSFRTLYAISRRAIMIAVDGASNPKISPIQYAASMVAIVGLALKVVDEVIK